MSIEQTCYWTIRCDMCSQTEFISHQKEKPEYPADWKYKFTNPEYGKDILWLCPACVELLVDDMNQK